jgi:hypothetical protein
MAVMVSILIHHGLLQLPQALADITLAAVVVVLALQILNQLAALAAVDVAQITVATLWLALPILAAVVVEQEIQAHHFMFQD